MATLDEDVLLLATTTGWSLEKICVLPPGPFDEFAQGVKVLSLVRTGLVMPQAGVGAIPDVTDSLFAAVKKAKEKLGKERVTLDEALKAGA